MPNTSSLQQQALDCGGAILANTSQGQTMGQNLKIQIEALAAAVVMLATAVNVIATNTTTVGASLSATLGTALTPGGTGFSAANTQLPTNLVGSSADPVTFASVLSGAFAIACQQP